MRSARGVALLSVVLIAPGCVGPEIEIRSQFEVFIGGENERCGSIACGGEGYGQASVAIDDEKGELCYDLELTDIPDSTSAHVHSGGLEDVGEVVLELRWTSGSTEGSRCLQGIDPELLSEIRHNPRMYYLDVHSERFPEGAARGQFQT